MSEENVDLVRRAFEEFLAGRRDFGEGIVHPDVVWDASRMDLLDSSGIYHGPEGVRGFWREWLSAWETLEFEYEMRDAGDRVVVLIDQRMRGRASGIEVEIGRYAQIYTLREGLIVHWELHPTWSGALQAAGLEPSSA
jgi:ketosteroid isomerase-like protein